MSVTEILNNVEGLETSKFEQLYKEMFALHAKRNNIPRLNEVESQLLNHINKEFDTEKWDRLTYLDWKLEFAALSPKEEAESLKLAEAYESFSVERVKSLSKLATIRGVSIDVLMMQLGLKPQLHG